MKQQNSSSNRTFRLTSRAIACAVSLCLGVAVASQAMAAVAAKAPKAPAAKAEQTVDLPAQVGQPIHAAIGKSTLVRLPGPVTRMSVGNPAVAEVTLISPREVYLLGKAVGSTNIILWGKSGTTTIIDVSVGMDSSLLNRLMPAEKDIKMEAAGDSIVLTGEVSDAVRADQAVSLAESYGGKKVVNMLRVKAPQQVMLEVKIAEVSKSLIDKLGAKFSRQSNGPWLLSSTLLSGGNGLLSWIRGGTSLTLDGERDNSVVKVLAEPNIMAISGQEGAFLSGGKIFIPVPQSSTGGAAVITLQEEDFGIGLRFLPTVLEGGLINLRVTPEVSEVSKEGTAITLNNVTNTVLPTITTNRAATTIQLHDGQTFAIGGLIKNNVSTSLKAFPGLGELPILGALFRSTNFQQDKTELLFVVTPHLVKPLPPDYALPTDSYVPPTRSELFLEGKLEGKSDPGQAKKEEPAKSPAKAEPAAPASKPSGFEMK